MNRLKEFRIGAALTQQKLAALSGINRVTISNIERGFAKNMRLNTIERLAAALGCEPKDLM